MTPTAVSGRAGCAARRSPEPCPAAHWADSARTRRAGRTRRSAVNRPRTNGVVAQSHDSGPSRLGSTVSVSKGSGGCGRSSARRRPASDMLGGVDALKRLDARRRRSHHTVKPRVEDRDTGMASDAAGTEHQIGVMCWRGRSPIPQADLPQRNGSPRQDGGLGYPGTDRYHSACVGGGQRNGRSAYHGEPRRCTTRVGLRLQDADAAAEAWLADGALWWRSMCCSAETGSGALNGRPARPRNSPCAPVDGCVAGASDPRGQLKMVLRFMIDNGVIVGIDIHADRHRLADSNWWS